MGMGKKILWGVIGLIILNTCMDFIVSLITGAMGLSLTVLDVDMSSWINGAIAGILNALFILMIGLMPSGSEEK